MRVNPTFDPGFGAGPADEDGRPGAPGDGRGTALSTAVQLSIGEMLQRDGVLDSDDIERVLALQEQDGLRFGEAALKLKLIKASDLERALSAQFAHPCLQVIANSSLSRELVAAHRPGSPQVELLRQQRSLLVQHWFAAHPALAVVSPGHGDGRSYFAANLAVLFGHLGRQTLLIDADMRHPRQQQLFGMPNRQGLSLVLAGRLRPMQAVQPIAAISTLALMTAGPVPPNPLELLDRGGLAGALKELARHFSVIIVDTPAGGEHGDARVVARHCRGALVLLRRHRTRLRDARGLAGRLARADVQLVGTVLNQY